ncbi:MAG TPA: MBL fold metallo-hydrolase RNA specificity domain-containing protein [Pseudomonas sp.]|uniref:MBL fold metallo-hydrolase RNA specificity domain-containing protein n=1 Tax=Pseudomonas sp. TaxID=306 RepID=UPI002B5B3912|nr:MBL fold metallo-hydrolase RNA specificity domain-containing protein [Pseudomonas sp.]HRL93824.1 MBL fold metallo-hydrolase RNA specificity domain-containing protein [Pseudomonas sp.]
MLLGEVRYNIGAKISGVSGCSAHADQQGLLGFVTHIDAWSSEIRIVHGDAAAKKCPGCSLLGAIPAGRLPSRV